MTSSEEKDRNDRLVKAFLGGLSAEEMDTQRRREYRQGYPKATAAEIQLLMDADDKAGYPPQGLGHARYIMRSSVGARLPAPTAKDFDDAALAAQAAYLKLKAREAIKLEYSSASAIALAQKYLRAKWDDTELALHASAREHKAREAAKSKPGSPSSGALVMARTLKWVAEENGDAELMAHGIELERRALEAIKLPEFPEVQKPAT